MIGSALLNKILGGGLAVLGAVCIYLYIGWQGAENAHLTTINKLTEVTGALNRQNDAVRQLEAEGDRLRADVEAAKASGEEGIAKARREAGKVRQTPPNGCPTPSQIMGADL